jgi:hypothetical protein
MLHPLFWDIINLKTTFTHLSFTHVYRDKTIEADNLSKEGFELHEET